MNAANVSTPHCAIQASADWNSVPPNLCAPATIAAECANARQARKTAITPAVALGRPSRGRISSSAGNSTKS